jgi:hypothetical protein
MTPRVIINWIVQPHIDVVRPTSRDVSNVAIPTCQTWQTRRFKRGKTDVSNVASETFQTWQERRFKGGKRDVLKVARETF